jgi:Fe2+ transport system protein FeoA
MEQADCKPASRVSASPLFDTYDYLLDLSRAKPGWYFLSGIIPINNRLLEMGFIKQRKIYVIDNSFLGIKIRLGASVYLINRVLALSVFLTALEE